MVGPPLRQDGRDGDFFVAYRDGVNNTWNAVYCCLGRDATGPDDVGFLGRLIDDVEAD